MSKAKQPKMSIAKKPNKGPPLDNMKDYETTLKFYYKFKTLEDEQKKKVVRNMLYHFAVNNLYEKKSFFEKLKKLVGWTKKTKSRLEKFQDNVITDVLVEKLKYFEWYAGKKKVVYSEVKRDDLVQNIIDDTVDKDNLKMTEDGENLTDIELRNLRGFLKYLTRNDSKHPDFNKNIGFGSYFQEDITLKF